MKESKIRTGERARRQVAISLFSAGANCGQENPSKTLLSFKVNSLLIDVLQIRFKSKVDLFKQFAAAQKISICQMEPLCES